MDKPSVTGEIGIKKLLSRCAMVYASLTGKRVDLSINGRGHNLDRNSPGKWQQIYVDDLQKEFKLNTMLFTDSAISIDDIYFLETCRDGKKGRIDGSDPSTGK